MSRPDYEGWWLNRRCRRAGSTDPFKLVKNVKWVGPPSRVYGIVVLTFADGTEETISAEYRPRKSDVDVEP